MNAPKLIEVIEIYRAKLAHIVPCKEAYPHDVLLRDEWSALKHARHCLDEIEAFVREGRLEKAFRWLGFVQGVLWACRVYDINELKGHNKPDDQGTELKTEPDPMIVNMDARETMSMHPKGMPPPAWAIGAMIPLGTPVKILAGGPYGTAEKIGVVDQHIGAAYGVRIPCATKDEKGHAGKESTQVVYAEQVALISGRDL